MPAVNEIEKWTGRDVVGPDGEKIGSFDHLYVDRETGEPTFIAVKTGLFGLSDSLVPVNGATAVGDDVVAVVHEKAKVKDAPNVKADDELSLDEEAKLYEYYGLSNYSQYDGPDHDTIAPAAVEHPAPPVDPEPAAAEGAVTRSEEELHVGTERRETGRARLRKVVVTENVTKTVPVQREEVVIEREPIDETDTAAAGAQIGEAEQEVVLHEEEVVTEKRVVPKERVSLGVETHTDEVQVDEQVRKEQIETDNDPPSSAA